MKKQILFFWLTFLAVTVLAFIVPITDHKISVINHVIMAAGGGEDTNRWALGFKKSLSQIAYTSQNFTNLFTVTNTSCSILLWVNITDPGGDQEYGFLEMANADPATGAFIFEWVEGWGENYFIVRLDHTTETVKSTAGFTPTYGQWNLVGVVKSNNVYTFTRNATNDSPSTVATVSAAFGKMYISGGSPQWGGRLMNGGMRKIWIYNRAVASSEITNLYNGGVWTTNYSTSGLVAYWACNEGAGTNIADSIGGNAAQFTVGATAPTWTNWAQ